jgi:hypothetical protein
MADIFLKTAVIPQDVNGHHRDHHHDTPDHHGHVPPLSGLGGKTGPDPANGNLQRLIRNTFHRSVYI